MGGTGMCEGVAALIAMVLRVSAPRPVMTIRCKEEASRTLARFDEPQEGSYDFQSDPWTMVLCYHIDRIDEHLRAAVI